MLCEIELPQVLLGLLMTLFTAVGFMYREMRADHVRLQAAFDTERARCGKEVQALNALVLETQRKIGVCVVPNCPARMPPLAPSPQASPPMGARE